MAYGAPATVGDGVCVRTSTLPNAGLGLFTTRAVPRNALITEYVGAIIDRHAAKQLRRGNAHSHVRALNMQHTYIDGLKHPLQAQVQGGGSFANDGRGVLPNNAECKTRYDHLVARDRVYLKATQDLQPHTEVLVNYGTTYWDLADAAAEQPAMDHQQQPTMDHQQQQQQQQQRAALTADQQQQQQQQQVDAPAPPLAAEAARGVAQFITRSRSRLSSGLNSMHQQHESPSPPPQQQHACGTLAGSSHTADAAAAATVVSGPSSNSSSQSPSNCDSLSVQQEQQPTLPTTAGDVATVSAVPTVTCAETAMPGSAAADHKGGSSGRAVECAATTTAAASTASGSRRRRRDSVHLPERRRQRKQGLQQLQQQQCQSGAAEQVHAPDAGAAAAAAALGPPGSSPSAAQQHAWPQTAGVQACGSAMQLHASLLPQGLSAELLQQAVERAADALHHWQQQMGAPPALASR